MCVANEKLSRRSLLGLGENCKAILAMIGLRQPLAGFGSEQLAGGGVLSIGATK